MNKKLTFLDLIAIRLRSKKMINHDSKVFETEYEKIKEKDIREHRKKNYNNIDNFIKYE